LILLDEPQVMPLGVEDLSAQVALTEHRVAGDQTAFQHQPVQQPKRGLVFIRLVDAALRDLGLGDRQPRLVGEQREQMHRLVQAVETPAGRLTVEGARLGWRLVRLEWSAQHGYGPPRQGALQRGPTQRDEHLANATRLGRPPRESETVHEGDIPIASPLADGVVTARAAHDGAANQPQHGG
jgi:hypothetical protein